MAAESWPFTGRDDLLTKVAEVLASSTTVILTGRAGLGKTRAANEVAATQASAGVGVHRIVASPASSPIPLAPLAHLIGDATGAAAVTALLHAVGAERRRGPADPILIVDDLHLLDDATATVIHQLALAGGARILATRRSGVSTPTAVERLQLEAGTVTIEVEPMPDAALLAMVEAALAGSLDRRTGELLCAVAGGNPLYAHEIVEGSIAAGTLSHHAGLWQLDGTLSTTPLLEEVVVARLAPLSGKRLEAMELLSIGGALDFAMLDGVVGAAALEELERLELITTTSTSTSTSTSSTTSTSTSTSAQLIVDVAHPLHRELLRARLGAIARMRISRTLASAGGPPGDDRPLADNLRSAVWHVRGGLDVEPGLLIGIAQHALRAGDPALASELAVHGFNQTGSPNAAMLASWCFAQTGDHERAIELIDTARRATRDPWVRAAMRMRVAEELWWTGRTAEGLAELDGNDDPAGPWDDLLTAQRGVFAMLDGDVAGARRHCEPLIDHDHLWVRYAAAVAIGNVGLIADEPERALALCGKVHAEANAGDVELVGGADIHLAIQLNALIHAGQLELGLQLAEAAHAQAAQQPSPQVRAWAATLLGRASMFTGDLRTTTRVTAEAERLWQRSGHEGLAAWCAAGLAQAQVQVGATEEAADTLARLDRYVRCGFGQYESTIDVARAWVAHAHSDRAGAAGHLVTAVAATTERQQTTLLGWVWHDAARLDLLALLPDRRAWERPQQQLSAIRWDFVQARATGDQALMISAGDQFEAIGARLYAAEARSLAAGLARRNGDAREASRLDARAGALVALCGGLATPPLAGRQGTGPLSAREHEIATLATGGLSNRQIAEQLIVSERTVENHLYRVFIKLGIGSRDELAAALSS
jgi:DNA-binding CsgD family transcriptional regulator